MNNKDTIQQIIDSRSRRNSSIAAAELFSRLLELEISYEEKSDSNHEELKYYPIALVACVESYYRLIIKELVDSSDVYFDRASKTISKLKIDFDAIKALRGGKISIGEMIAHIVSTSSLANINSQITALLGQDFLKELRSAYD